MRLKGITLIETHTMKSQIPHDLTHATDPDGRAVVGVRLSNRSKVAWLYLTDYLRIIKQYGTPVWAVSGNGRNLFYVRFRVAGEPNHKLTVARLVAGDFEKTGVRYLDGNPLNLRNVNLIHDKGRGGRPSRFPSLMIPTGNGRTRG